MTSGPSIQQLPELGIVFDANNNLHSMRKLKNKRRPVMLVVR